MQLELPLLYGFFRTTGLWIGTKPLNGNVINVQPAHVSVSLLIPTHQLIKKRRRCGGDRELLLVMAAGSC
jgi:hypothetical protein